ncbi:MAG: holo-ACP synthase [Chloroflexi bacterium]|nr:holo-ACP synthase [Chloroflexota bacterium]
MISAGVDAVEISRIEKSFARFGERFLQRVYTPREVDRYRYRVRELAARFAAKEAVSKALGTGMRHGVAWRQIEVLPDSRGKPLVYLHGEAAARARELGLNTFAISLTHTDDVALAFVVATRE